MLTAVCTYRLSSLLALLEGSITRGDESIPPRTVPMNVLGGEAEDNIVEE